MNGAPHPTRIAVSGPGEGTQGIRPGGTRHG